MSSTQQGPESLHARVAAALDHWKRRLLDLSKRNRALNFRPTKVSTVPVVDEQPAQVFSHLYIAREPMRFRARPEPEEPSDEAKPQQGGIAEQPGTEHDALEDLDVEAVSIPYVPYSQEDLEDRHLDDVLQTALEPDHLDRALRRLDEIAATMLQEQGVNPLFLTLGMLEYSESSTSTEVYRAPLVLVPVTLSRKSARAGYTLAVADDDAIVNPALVELMRLNYHVNL